MLEKIGMEPFRGVSTPSRDMVLVLKSILEKDPFPVVAEVGVGVGATTLECARIMDNKGTIHIFDFDASVSELANDLSVRGLANIVTHGNTRLTYDSYCWNLAKILKEQRAHGTRGTFNLAYLDGAHNFLHDAPAAFLLAELLKPNGYLLFDDLNWTYSKSPTLNPQINPHVKKMLTQEQIETPHVLLICELFFDHNPQFERDTLSGTISTSRALYRKLA